MPSPDVLPLETVIGYQGESATVLVPRAEGMEAEGGSVSDNIIRLNNQQVHELGEPIETLIETLENVLEMAKSGRLQSFVGTGFTADGCRMAIWHATHSNVYAMLGAINWLEHEYVARTIETNGGQHP